MQCEIIGTQPQIALVLMVAIGILLPIIIARNYTVHIGNRSFYYYN
jgi:hypothetical protein